MLLTDLVDAIVALGDPAYMDTEKLSLYPENLEWLLCDTYGFNIINDWITIDVDDHGEALREAQFIREEDGIVIGYRFRQHPDWGITSVYKPYFMKPRVVTTYVYDRPVVEKY